MRLGETANQIAVTGHHPVAKLIGIWLANLLSLVKGGIRSVEPIECR